MKQYSLVYLITKKTNLRAHLNQDWKKQLKILNLIIETKLKRVIII